MPEITKPTMGDGVSFGVLSFITMLIKTGIDYLAFLISNLSYGLLETLLHSFKNETGLFRVIPSLTDFQWYLKLYDCKLLFKIGTYIRYRAWEERTHITTQCKHVSNKWKIYT